MKKNANMIDLFMSELNDIASAEDQIIQALPTMIKASDSEELKVALQTHLDETKVQAERLEEIFDILQEKRKKITCEAMQGLIEEASEPSKDYSKSALRDAALISKAQRIEHYEISAYGTLRTFAKELGYNEIAKLLQKTLDEEMHADKLLSKLAEGGLLTTGINHKAHE